MNHVLHIAAIVQLRHDTCGRAYFLKKLAAGKTRMEALRCLKRRLSDVVYRRLVADAGARSRANGPGRALRGDSHNPARSTCTRTSTLRISHFPDPQHRRYARPSEPERPQPQQPTNLSLDTEGSQMSASPTGPRAWLAHACDPGRNLSCPIR